MTKQEKTLRARARQLIREFGYCECYDKDGWHKRLVDEKRVADYFRISNITGYPVICVTL